MPIYRFMDIVYVPCTRYAHLNLFHLVRTRLQECIQPWARPKQLEVVHFYCYTPQVKNMEPKMMVYKFGISQFLGGYIWKALGGYISCTRLYLTTWLGWGRFFRLPSNPLPHHFFEKNTHFETKKCRYRRCHHFLACGRMDDCRCFTEVTAFVLLRQCGYTAQSWGQNTPWINEQLAGPNNLSNWHHFSRYHLIPRNEQIQTFQWSFHFGFPVTSRCLR